MFNSSKKETRTSAETTSLIASGTQIRGDVQFSGRLHVDGKIEGSIRADDAAAVLTLSSHANVIGEIQAPHIVINEVMICPTWNRGYVAALQKAGA